MEINVEFRGSQEDFDESLGVPGSLDLTSSVLSDCETLDEISSGIFLAFT